MGDLISLANIDPQSGADGIITVADIVAVLVDVADTVDIGGTILITAGRPQPPPAVAVEATVEATNIRSIGNCIIRRLTPSCTIRAEILVDFSYAE